MARDGGRGRGSSGRGRGRPKKNTGVRLDLGSGSRPSTSSPTTTTTDTAITSPPFVATGGLSAGLPQMVMIPTPGSRVQSFDTAGTDVVEDDTEAVASAIADPRPLLLWDGHDCWDDVRAGTKEITNIFLEHSKWYAPQFSQAPDEAIEFWFARGNEANIRKAWEIRAAKRHRGMMHNIREKGAPHHWIPDDIFRRYVDYWASADFQARRRANKSNRASITGGSLHTGGSTTYPATAKKMATELGRVPSQSEEQHNVEIKCLEDERAARIAAGEPAGPPIDEDEGKVPKRPVPRLVDPEDASTCSGPDAREHITLLNREIQQQAEGYKQEMEAWKRWYETDVTRLHTSLDTQTAEFDQWKSMVSQMYSFMKQMQGSSSSGMPPPPPPPPSSAPRLLRAPPVATAGAPTVPNQHLDVDGSFADDEDYD
ncbi:hypothetical protein PIB30_033257 [Stylosanthes scabra]|uniref:Uncharacterized protein n=1 Tax=Stylosanthes scabra TaxID=79078 RepID=A0ABU6YB97_9FABA|nr:hypothetical protein [Stylosanthes scabra]